MADVSDMETGYGCAGSCVWICEHGSGRPTKRRVSQLTVAESKMAK